MPLGISSTRSFEDGDKLRRDQGGREYLGKGQIDTTNVAGESGWSMLCRQQTHEPWTSCVGRQSDGHKSSTHAKPKAVADTTPTNEIAAMNEGPTSFLRLSRLPHRECKRASDWPRTKAHLAARWSEAPSKRLSLRGRPAPSAWTGRPPS